MKFDFKGILKLIISLLIGGGLLWYLFRDLSEQDKAEIWNSLINIKPIYIVIVVLLSILACVIRAYRWNMLLESIGYQPKIITLTCSIFVMYLGNLLFPRLGEILRCTILQDHEEIPLEKSIGTMIVERIIDVVGMGVIAMIAVVFEYDIFFKVYESYQSKKGESSLVFPLFVLVVILIGAIFIWKNPSFKAKIMDKLNGMMDGVKSVFLLKNPILFIIYSVLIYFIYFITTFIFYQAIHGTEMMTFSSASLILTFGTLAVGLTQGGLGAYQFLVTFAMELYNIPHNVGLAYSWSNWLIQNATLVIFGIVSWGYLMLYSRGKK